jgi:head-tail adaptor
MPTGDLRERVAFDLRSGVSDGAGNFEDAWTETVAPVAARIRPLKGGESVVAQRLQGSQPVVITVRSSAATRALTTDCRARALRSGKTYNVTAVTPDERRAYVDLLCVAGGADG